MKLIASFVVLLVGGFIIGAFGFGNPTGGGGGSDGPLIDPEVVAIMEKEPDTRHDLILSIRLNRAPINLESSLATNGERNECTQAFCDWEELIEKQKSGDDSVTDNDIVAAYDYAMWLDSFVLEKDTIAREAYQQDYSALSRESCQPVYDSLKAMFGENIRWPTENLNMFAIKANRGEFERMIQVDGIKRVSLDMQMTGFLDISRQNIRAKDVHDGVGGVGPYTGDGIKVAVIDSGYDTLHSRLPSVSTENQFDEVDGYGIGGCIHTHGTGVAGVVFCQPDSVPPDDLRVGIAPDAIPVIAKVLFTDEDGPGSGCLPGSPESWDVDLDAFDWATSTETGFPGAKIVNFSRGFVIYGTNGGRDPSLDTLASDYSSMDIDWLVYSRDVCFVQACGNIENSALQLAPPSGSYNCIAVGAYDDKGTAPRQDPGFEDKVYADVTAPITFGTSPGPADDGRKKPDISAPGVGIDTTFRVTHDFANFTGTSFAAPHIAAVCALLKEAKPSLTARQIKAILINAVEYVPHPDGTNFAGNGVWNNQGGWGALDAYNAVSWRNHTYDDSLDEAEEKSYYLGGILGGQKISVTCVWERAMQDAGNPVSGSPGDLDLFLEKLVGTTWTYVTSSESGDLLNDGTVFDNVEQVYWQTSISDPLTSFRVRVVRADDHDISQGFTLAARKRLLSTP